jgi:hypothetical protein
MLLEQALRVAPARVTAQRPPAVDYGGGPEPRGAHRSRIAS